MVTNGEAWMLQSMGLQRVKHDQLRDWTTTNKKERQVRQQNVYFCAYDHEIQGILPQSEYDMWLEISFPKDFIY